MLPRLLEFLVCPVCKQKFEVEAHSSHGENIIQGILKCPCGKRYPIANTIPRILPDAINDFSLEPRTSFDHAQMWSSRTFGFQWKLFKKMSDKFEGNFLNYIYPINKSFFKGKFGLDTGCGFGRHIFYAASFGAEMVGIDLSEAIDSTYQNTKHLPNVHLVQCDIYNLPFKKEIFDFIYCIGVLHHLPNPEAGFKNLVCFLKKKSPIFIWVYSSTRRYAIFFIESIRKITKYLPLRTILIISFVMSSFDWFLFILPYRLMLKIRIPQRFLNKIIFPRIILYSRYPFGVSWADWFDRLSPPIRFYYNADEVRQWFRNMNMNNIRISETGLYGWRGYGEK